MQTTSPAHESLAQLEHSLSEALVRENTRLEITNGQFGKYSLLADKYPDFSARHGHYYTGDASIRLSITRNEPSLMMFFLLQGNVLASTKAWQNSFQTRQQLISLFPSCHYFMHLPNRAVMQHTSIQLTPRLFQDVLIENENPVTDFIYETVAREESLPKIKGALILDATTHETLQSMYACPYRGKMRELYLEAQTKLLLVHQLNVLTQAVLNKDLSGETKLTRSDVERLHELRQYLETHFLEEHTLQSLSRQFGLNLFKLKYGFRKLFGHSVMKWLDDKKLQHAHVLLLKENASVFDVATQLNYQHPNNFSAAFKRKFGHSPQGLRKI